jgi:hypothetical protein
VRVAISLLRSPTQICALLFVAVIVKNTQRKHAINSNEIITSTSRIMQLLEVRSMHHASRVY